MLRLEMLPAGHGDCLWLEYGCRAKPRRILIDGGASGTYKRALRDRLRALPQPARQFELLVVTHIDADHIAGVLDLLDDEETGFSAKDCWFNGYRHLPDEAPDTLGPLQGEKLTMHLRRRAWNCAFDGAAAVWNEDGELPRHELEGGLVLTLLSPTPARLADLKPSWEAELRKAGLDPRTTVPDRAADEGFELLAAGKLDVDALAATRFSEDDAVANGSSVALLMEYEGRRLLLAGDAYPSVLARAVRRLSPDAPYRVDACKLPHHGSKSNVSADFLQTLACNKWLFSSNGAYFKHPDAEAVARVIKKGGKKPELLFNYRTAFNERWAAPKLQSQHGYTAVYPKEGDPKEGEGGLVLEWD